VLEEEDTAPSNSSREGGILERRRVFNQIVPLESMGIVFFRRWGNRHIGCDMISYKLSMPGNFFFNPGFPIEM